MLGRVPGWPCSGEGLQPAAADAERRAFSFFGSFVFGTPGFPLSDVPLQTIADQVAAGRYGAKPWRVFRFEDIREAHRVMEANEAGGKMVVRVQG
jgi:NADPH:quinone reductase-like Zn-dependent oxidoreductase